MAVSACSTGDNGKDDGDGTTPGSGFGWTVDTSKCADPKAATEKIDGTINVGTVMPLSGSVASAYAPLRTGMEAFFAYTNANNPIPNHPIKLHVGDDQYNPAMTPSAVNTLLDQGAQVFAGIVGTPSNMAVRELLNQNCVPQLHASTGGPALNDVAKYPWTSGQTAPFDVEGQIWATKIKQDFPAGAKVATFLANSSVGSDTGGGFQSEAAKLGIEIVSKQTIEPTQTTPPTAQLNAIAASKAPAIFAVPLGSQCGTFLKELANVKAANAGWTPQVYLTSTCAFQSVLAAAGPAANGVIAASSYLDTGDTSVVAGNKELTYLKEQLTKSGQEKGIAVAAVGWAVADILTAALRKAAASPAGLTQASILEAHRTIDYHSSVMRPGVNARMSGDKDDVLIQSLQIIKFDATASKFTDMGALITSFESS
ncbi:MAG TPA: ABC transporter substrate-binding protein [Micromonosporaceae bacterium]